jgi:hypothetical protein
MLCNRFVFAKVDSCRSPWPSSLRHGFTAAHLLGLWVWIPSACLEVTCREYVRCPKLVKIYHVAGGCTKLTFFIRISRDLWDGSSTRTRLVSINSIILDSDSTQLILNLANESGPSLVSSNFIHHHLHPKHSSQCSLLISRSILQIVNSSPKFHGDSFLFLSFSLYLSRVDSTVAIKLDNL